MLPCEQATLSSEQLAIVGQELHSTSRTGWHVYWADDDGFVTFFTWGGKPDDGFGGHRRIVRLTDGTDEYVKPEYTSPDVAMNAGLPKTVDSSYLLPGQWVLPVACFVRLGRFEREVTVHLPDVEVVDGVARWRGRESKAEFMARERERRDALRDVLKARYKDDTTYGGWYGRATDDELDELRCRPYSELGPATKDQDDG